MTLYESIHQRALRSARQFQKAESELICCIQQVEAKKVFLRFGCTSLFQYCQKHLRLSESSTYLFIRVARKALQIPEIQRAIQAGTLVVARNERSE